MTKRNRTILGVMFLVVAIILLLTMNQIVFPVINGSIDTGEYYIRIGINVLRYSLLSVILSVIGLKLCFTKR